MADSFKISITLSPEIHFLCFSEFYTKVCKPMVIRKLIEQCISFVTEFPDQLEIVVSLCCLEK